MRAGIGLVGLLVGVGLLVYLFAQHSIPTAREGKKAQEEAAQIAGLASTTSFSAGPGWTFTRLVRPRSERNRR